MMLGVFIVAGAASQVAGSNAVRWIQARSSDKLLSVVSNYGVAFLVAWGYWVLKGTHGEGVAPAVAIGVPGGFIYTAALLTIIRSMDQRGLALTIAFAALGQLVPCLVSVLMGETLGWLPGAGLLLAAAALPLLSLATASGTAIKEPSNLGLAGLLFVLQGGAMTANLLASRLVTAVHFPTYLVALFGSAFAVSAILWWRSRGAAAESDTGRGVLFGLLNVTGTLVIVTGASSVSSALFFAGMSVTALVLTTLLAMWWWRERVQAVGWFGLGLAGAALVLLNL